jgi:hypothetical protein
MGIQLLYGKGPLPLLRAGSRAARGNITISDIPNLNYYVIFIVYIQFTNVSAGRIIQPGGPRVGDSCYRLYCGGLAWFTAHSVNK